MKILYLSYWGVNDGLTVSVIYPHLLLLSKQAEIKEIIFVSIEREEKGDYDFRAGYEKVTHKPLFTEKLTPNLLNKVNDFILFPNKLKELLKQFEIDKAISHGAPGGALLYMVCKNLSIPFYVFFEPHSAYMLEAGVWKWYDPRYLFQKYWEKQQVRYASGIFTVTHNNRKELISSGVDSKKLGVAPNSVDFKRFLYDSSLTSEMRQKLGISAAQKVGIYVGKFGGIYYDREAFRLFKQTSDFLKGNFFLILLTPDSAEDVRRKLSDVGFPQGRAFVGKVPHAEVPHYLNVADFAFSLQNYKPSNRYLCPIKNGEYWACGLPILLPDGVGDDSDIVKSEGGGVIFEVNNFEMALRSLEHRYLARGKDAYYAEIRALAEKHRNFERTREVYEKILSHSSNQ